MSDYSNLLKQIDESLQIEMRRMQLQTAGVSEEDAVIISKHPDISEQLIYRIKNGYDINYTVMKTKLEIVGKKSSDKDKTIKQLQEENELLKTELNKNKTINLTINISCNGLNDNIKHINEQITKSIKEQMKTNYHKV